jgi:hypothetical protein
MPDIRSNPLAGYQPRSEQAERALRLQGSVIIGVARQFCRDGGKREEV